MSYYNYYYGMNLIWWIIWGILIFWIFVLPYDIPFQRKAKNTPLDVLKKRFVSGQINEKEYEEKKRILEGL